jgi:hypothetical protein
LWREKERGRGIKYGIVDIEYVIEITRCGRNKYRVKNLDD